MADDVTALTLRLLEERIPFCLATVVLAGEATGVRVGEKLLVRHEGDTSGVLGNGVFTRAVAQAASEQLHRETIAVARFTANGERLPERRSLRGATPAPDVLEVSLEPMLPPLRLIIFGAGHIAVPLASLATLVGFEVTVVDDRDHFANHKRFPEAKEIIVGEFQSVMASQELSPWTYVVLVTRGHEHDEAILQWIVDSPVPYIGMIGSRRRVLVVFQRLAKLGISEDRLRRVYAPIGLDIGSRTPEEIALAIMAEIVNVRRGGSAPSLSLWQRMGTAASS